MGCDCHIIVQILDPMTNEYKFVRESVCNTRKFCLGNDFNVVVYSPSTEKLASISSEDFKLKLSEHKECENEKCECQDDFYTQFHIKRDYTLFAKIANVRARENETGNMEPRGIPNDADNLLKHLLLEPQNGIEHSKMYDPSELHSHTYLSDIEIDNLNFEDKWGGLSELKTLLARVRDSFPGLSSRFIIAFDN
jgi:hypothetical protein